MKHPEIALPLMAAIIILALLLSAPYWAIDATKAKEAYVAQCKCLLDHPDEFKGHYHCTPQNSTEDDLISDNLQNYDGCVCVNKYGGQGATCMV